MPSTTATLLKALGGLMVVVCTIFLASALAKRVGLTNVSLRKRIQLRENVVVGNKERLVLVDFAGQSLLLGVTAGSISLLKTVPQINVGQNVAAKENSLGAKTALDFQQKLNAFLLKGQQ
jgi:flagellar protein FliO/FliZ